MPERHRFMPLVANRRVARAAEGFGHRGSKVLWFLAALTSLLLMAAVVRAVLPVGRHSNPYSRENYEIGVLLAGIPQEGQALGAPTAPITLQVFAELEDPSSQKWFLAYLPAIISEFVRTGRLRIEYRAFKTNTIESETFVKQQAAALAAGEQDKLWNYAYVFYCQQRRARTPYVTESFLENIARQVPALNIKRWDRDRDADSGVEQVVEEDQQGRAEGIHVTPAYRIGHTGRALRNFTGSKSHLYGDQTHPTTWASAEDIAQAIDQLH